ncbi:MAG: GNAT family N-acetyltransferase [Rickettsiales bacterium]|nr:GNAT family N-acetyltransferase [Rickettsiales bacterium]
MQVLFECPPKPSDVNFLNKKLNEETSQYGKAYPVIFFIKNDQGRVIAGANAIIIYGAIYTDQLWVDKEHRNKGLATKIMYRIHEFGKEKGCKIATIQTMSFQKAVKFYEKLGYTEDFVRPNYVKGSSCIFMSKTL